MLSGPVQFKPIVLGSTIIASRLLREEKCLFTFTLCDLNFIYEVVNIKNTFLCNTVVSDWAAHITTHWENSKMQTLTSIPTPATRIKCIFKRMF